MGIRRTIWWDNLPPKEKAIRETIDNFKKTLKMHKSKIPMTRDEGKEYHVRQASDYNVLIRALKHELERGGTAKVRLNESGFYCNNCCQFVQKFDNFCHVCGKKLDWTVAKEQYEQHHLLEMAENFLGSIKSSRSTNQKLYHLDRALEMLDALQIEYEKKVKKDAD